MGDNSQHIERVLLLIKEVVRSYEAAEEGAGLSGGRKYMRSFDA